MKFKYINPVPLSIFSTLPVAHSCPEGMENITVHRYWNIPASSAPPTHLFSLCRVRYQKSASRIPLLHGCYSN